MCYEWNESLFEGLKIECKKEGVSYRIIDGQFYKEKSQDEVIK